MLELKKYQEKETDMKVIRASKVKKEPHSGKLFTGPVTMQPIIGKELNGDLIITQVNFGPGVRNKFHSHSREQILIVTKGKGIVATEKEHIIISRGDVVLIPPGEKHWHGAAEGYKFSHLYIMSPGGKTTQLEV
jgi:quercetin dioxygenase-like cupin family protein